MGKNFNDEKGWGHISCEAASRAHGKDVFLLQGELPEKEIVPVGTLLSFRVTPSAKGPQACDVRLLAPGSFAVGGQPGEMFNGHIKSFSAEKKWGFISGDEIQETFGKDV